MSALRIVITGGGTGGHLAIARTFLYEFKKRGFVCYFIGSLKGQDRDYFEGDKEWEKSFFLDTMGVVNQRGIKKLLSVFQQIRACLQTKRILRQIDPHFVLSVGGYSAAPASFMALGLKMPLIIHEQNAKIGRLNRILKQRATLFFSSYDSQSPIKDYPINPAFFQRARVREVINRILFMGGSQGARVINELALKMADKLLTRGVKIIHQCGINELKAVQQGYLQMGINPYILESDGGIDENAGVVLFGFYHQMSSVVERADFALSRSGASSLWELSANGLPALFIPYPYAADNHQFFNAEFLRQKNLCFLLGQAEADEARVFQIIDGLKDNEELCHKSKALAQLCSTNAAAKITDCILHTLGIADAL